MYAHSLAGLACPAIGFELVQQRLQRTYCSRLPTNSSVFALALTDAWCNTPALKLYVHSAEQVAPQVCQNCIRASIPALSRMIDIPMNAQTLLNHVDSFDANLILKHD